MKTIPLISAENDLQPVKTSRRGSVSRVASLITSAFLLASVPSYGAMVIDNFDDTSHISVSAGSATLDLTPGGLVITTAETSPGTWGAYGGQAIFFWSQDGGRYSGFSLDPADEQYVFSMSGVYNVTPSGSTDAFIYGFIYFFGGGIEPTPQTYYISDAIMRPVAGEWSFNVLDAATEHFSGSVPDGVQWTIELYIASGGQEGVGYRFDSIAAIPEPGTVGMLGLVGGLGMLRLGRRWLRRGIL